MIKKHPLYNKMKNGLCGYEQLFDLFRENKLIHHATNAANLLKILECDEIKYNDGSFKDSYLQSKDCYAKYKKCISLFDLVTPSIEQLIQVIDIWVSFVAKNNILICFDLKKLSDNIILNDKFRNDATKNKKMRIGYIEALYPIPLDIKLAKSFIVANNGGYKEYLNESKEIDQLKKILYPLKTKNKIEFFKSNY